MDKAKVTFLPYGKTIEVPAGYNLLRAAVGAGVHINASCGGAGTCGRCRVRVLEGETEGPGPDEQGWHRACQTKPIGEVVVQVAGDAVPDTTIMGEKRARVPVGRAVFEELNSDWHLEAPTRKRHFHVDPPTISNNRSDTSRLLRAVKNDLKLDNLRLSLELSRKLPKVLREKNWSVTTTVYLPEGERRRSDYYVSDLALATLTNVEAGDTTRQFYGVAIDVGTTGLCAELLDLNSGESLRFLCDYNPQRRFGDDVISRIVYSQKGDGLAELQKAVVGGINGLIDRLVEMVGIERSAIAQLTVAGNTTMAHLLLGIDPKYLRESPYVPATNFVAPLRASELGIDLGEHVIMFLFPSIASYVGGDIVSGLLASGVYADDGLTLYIDIGTNGEVAVGGKDWIMTASCSAGPAFEGGGVKCGMIAAPGAIENFDLDPRTLEPMLVTVGMQKPKGICGSGLISIVAELFSAGLLAPNGKFETDAETDRLRKGESGYEYVLAWKDEADADRDIVINEADVDNLVRAKGAMYAGCQTLIENAHLTFDDLDRVMIAGAFGSYLDLESAIGVGLFPDIAREKFLYIGNGSLAGAKLLNLSRKMVVQAETVSKMMTNVELSESPAFMDNYMASLFLPHTDPDRFPSLRK